MHEPTLPAVPRSLKVTALTSLALLFGLLVINQLLLSPEAPKGMFSLQLAATAARGHAIIAGWGPEGTFWAQVSLWLDYVLVGVYTLCLVQLTNYLLQDRPGIRERKIGHWVRALFIGAGLSDVAENTLLLNNLPSPTDGLSLAATVCALVKFTGLLLGAAGLIILRAARRHPPHHEQH
ncbi:MAG: hypothetical protein R3175_03695 [Marinobacter sp.]|uniref:hypothetical protein n=1 Tax=Marinobacter sp. TaxID=50741 RepID=UPI00299E024B|nr:hypothetical protein [Marinobacter sp.]MDX1755142.1 hypothetical protein [Marinobacter sp.]